MIQTKKLILISHRHSRSYWGMVKPMKLTSEIPAFPKFLKTPKTVSIVGASTSYGQPLSGAEEGPDILRKSGLRETLTDLDWRVEDKGNLKILSPCASHPVYNEAEYGGRAKNCFAVGQNCKMIYDQAYNNASQGNFVLTLGGDHSISAGSVSGVIAARPDLGVIWVDAHADLNTPAISPSGNMHGMPVAFLMGLVNAGVVPGWDWIKNTKLANDKIVYIGLRDIDEGEKKLLHKLGITVYTMQHIDKYGIGKVMEMTLEQLCHDGKTPLHLSYDIDAVDPIVAPASGTLVRGGLTFREANYVAEAAFETGQLGSLDMVEVNPHLSDTTGADMTAEAAKVFIGSAMGARIL